MKLICTIDCVTVGQLVYFVVSCFMNSCSDFLHTFCVYVVNESMFSELERLRAPAGRPCDNHVIGT